MSDRYINDRFLPDKAIDLIDEASSRKRINGTLLPENIKEIEKNIQRLNEAIDSYVKMRAFDKAGELEVQLKADEQKLADLRKDWTKEKVQESLVIDETDIANIVSSWTKIPVTKLTQTESEKLLGMEEILKKTRYRTGRSRRSDFKSGKKSESRHKRSQKTYRFVYIPRTYRRGKNRTFQSACRSDIRG